MPHTPEIPPPPRVPTRTSGRPSRIATVTRWGGAIAAVLAALGGGAGLRALWGQSEEQLRQGARIEAKLDGLAEGRKDDRVRLDALEQRERTNWARWETAHAMHFAAERENGGVEPPREAPAATKQIRMSTTRNAKKPVQASDQQGRALDLPAAAEPPGLAGE